MTKKVIIAFIPVLHRGVIDFFSQLDVKELYLLANNDVEGYEHLGREMRALSRKELTLLLEPLGIQVKEFATNIAYLQESSLTIYMPDEDISHAVAEKFFKQTEIIFVQTFLRWDWEKSTVQATTVPQADVVISKNDPSGQVLRKKMKELEGVAKKSSDFWRQVGALVWKDSISIIAYNKHFPNEYVPYIDGDPRNNFKPGEFNEIYTALHAEKGVISHAARAGIALEGADIFVTTFPCNDCANQIVETGIKRVYFTGGYSNLNGVKTLREHGVELVFIEM